MHRFLISSGISIVLGWVMPALAQHHHHAGDIVVGRSLGGQLKCEFPGEHVEVIPILSGPPGYIGWAGETPGFDHLEADEAEEDFWTLQTGVAIYLVAVDDALDSPVRVRDFDTLGVLIDDAGGAAFLGNAGLHKHVIWHVDPSVAGFDPLRKTYSGMFYLHDTSGTYRNSDPFLLRFEIVPEPVSLMFVLAGSAVVAFRPSRYRKSSREVG